MYEYNNCTYLPGPCVEFEIMYTRAVAKREVESTITERTNCQRRETREPRIPEIIYRCEAPYNSHSIARFML